MFLNREVAYAGIDSLLFLLSMFYRNCALIFCLYLICVITRRSHTLNVESDVIVCYRRPDDYVLTHLSALTETHYINHGFRLNIIFIFVEFKLPEGEMAWSLATQKWLFQIQTVSKYCSFHGDCCDSPVFWELLWNWVCKCVFTVFAHTFKDTTFLLFIWNVSILSFPFMHGVHVCG